MLKETFQPLFEKGLISKEEYDEINYFWDI